MRSNCPTRKGVPRHQCSPGVGITGSLPAGGLGPRSACASQLRKVPMAMESGLTKEIWAPRPATSTARGCQVQSPCRTRRFPQRPFEGEAVRGSAGRHQLIFSTSGRRESKIHEHLMQAVDARCPTSRDIGLDGSAYSSSKITVDIITPSLCAAAASRGFMPAEQRYSSAAR
jgi:hypothetical protein